MFRMKRAMVAAAIVLAGLALTPYVAFPSEGLDWERFERIYYVGSETAESTP
ncbi:MAG: hypothetical protein AAGF95_07130 [Chloroflexota bacterium]